MTGWLGNGTAGGWRDFQSSGPFSYQALYCLSGMVKFCLRPLTSSGMHRGRLTRAGVMVGMCSATWEAASVMRGAAETIRVRGVNDNDEALRKGRRLTGWTARRPTWSGSSVPDQVGALKGLWIPTAVRKTGVGLCSHPDCSYPREGGHSGRTNRSL